MAGQAPPCDLERQLREAVESRDAEARRAGQLQEQLAAASALADAQRQQLRVLAKHAERLQERLDEALAALHSDHDGTPKKPSYAPQTPSTPSASHFDRGADTATTQHSDSAASRGDWLADRDSASSSGSRVAVRGLHGDEDLGAGGSCQAACGSRGLGARAGALEMLLRGTFALWRGEAVRSYCSREPMRRLRYARRYVLAASVVFRAVRAWCLAMVAGAQARQLETCARGAWRCGLASAPAAWEVFRSWRIVAAPLRRPALWPEDEAALRSAALFALRQRSLPLCTALVAWRAAVRHPGADGAVAVLAAWRLVAVVARLRRRMRRRAARVSGRTSGAYDAFVAKRQGALLGHALEAWAWASRGRVLGRAPPAWRLPQGWQCPGAAPPLRWQHLAGARHSQWQVDCKLRVLDIKRDALREARSELARLTACIPEPVPHDAAQAW